MEQPGYERFGLISNPFQDLSSETLDDIELFHVEQEMDASFNDMKQEVFEKQRKAVVAMVGPLGVGKTQRLQVTLAEAVKVGAFGVFHQLTEEVEWVGQSLADDILEQVKLGGFAKAFSSPKWYRDLEKLKKRMRKGYDPERAGIAFATALNENAPAFLMLNDLHNLRWTDQTDRFYQLLQALTTHLKPGVMVGITCYPNYFKKLKERHPAFVTRFNRIFAMKPFSVDEAVQLVGRRLLGKRLIEDLDPIYPFTRDAVEEMLQQAQSNPRKVLKVADTVLEAAVRKRAFHVDAGDVREALGIKDAPPAAAAPQTNGAAKPKALRPVAKLKPKALKPVASTDGEAADEDA